MTVWQGAIVKKETQARKNDRIGFFKEYSVQTEMDGGRGKRGRSVSCKKVAWNTPGMRFHRERSVKAKEKHQSNMKTKSEVQLKKTGAWKQCED